MKDHFDIERLGGTLDDAVGECYDKVARVLGVAYPGGPIIDKMAHEGEDKYNLPVPLDDDSFNFSFSGLKSAVINLVHNLEQKKEELNKENLATSFQNVIIKSLVSKTTKAIDAYNVERLVLAGGVSANKGIRNSFEKVCQENNIELLIPELKYCTDNATMVAAAGYYLYKEKKYSDLELNALSSAKFE